MTLYRLLLALYPADFRRRFGAEMLELFETRRRDARTVPQRLSLWAGVLADATRSIIRERVPARSRIVDHVTHDIRHAWRVARSTPALSAFIVLLMALGIGTTTAVFSVVNAVLLQPLPFASPDRLMFVWEQRHAVRRNAVGGHEFPEWKAHSRSFEQMAAIAFDRDFSLTGAGDPAVLAGVRVTSDFFKVMGVAPVVGRVFGAEADEPGHGEVAVLSHRLWTERFGADRSVVGRTIELNDRPYTVAAVMPADFSFPANGAGAAPDVWTPIAEPIHLYRGRHYLFVVGRLQPGVTSAQAQTELSAIAAGVAREFPPNKDHGVNVQPIASDLVDEVRGAILLLFAAVGVVFVVGCCNVANVLLARATARQQEMAIRSALGAGRWRIARQLLIEGALLSGAASLGGVLIAVWLIALARTAVPAGIPRLDAAAIDPTALTFTAGLALATALLFGLVPALRLPSNGVAERLKFGGKGIPAPARQTLRSALIVAEVALTVALSIGAALLVQSVGRLNRVDPGFQPADVMTLGMTLPAVRYREPERLRAFYSDVVERVRGVAGVDAVAATNMVPHGGGVSGIGVAIEGRPPARPGEELSARYRIVSSDYFRTLGIPTLRGRTFRREDARLAVPLIRWFDGQPVHPKSGEPQAPPVAVLNDRMARELWPGEDPLGRRFRVLFSPPITVVGIVRDARNAALSDEPVAEFYLSDLQEPQSRMTLLIRAQDGEAVLPAVRALITGVDAKLPIASVRPLSAVIDTNLALHRFIALLMGGFSAIALVLMIAGLYGVISYATTQRTHEIGIRMALGATRVDIGGLIVRNGLAFCALGAAIGLGGGYALARSAATLLYQIEPGDPMTYVALVVGVLAVAAVASWIPARRAMRVHPAAVLRNE